MEPNIGWSSMSSYSELREKADAHAKRAETLMAACLAVEDGVLTEDEADEYLSLNGSHERVTSDLYPGDEYYDRASMQVEDMLL